MKHSFLYILYLGFILCCCRQPNTSPTPNLNNEESFVLDSTLRDSIKRQTVFVSDSYFSQIKTPIEFRFFSDNVLIDSIIQPDFTMTSWYSNNKDTIDLVAHVGEFETVALLVRFTNGRPSVFFYRASHEGQNIFRLNSNDSFTNHIEVLPTRYKLQLSQIPDTLNKPVIFGNIDMESSDYYDKRDTLQRKRSVQMKFNFRSQFRKFDY